MEKAGMFSFLRKRAYSIGIDLSNDDLKIVQLGNGGKGISLVAGKNEQRPPNVQPGSAAWQHWAVEVIREAIGDGKFRGKEIIAAIPAGDVFIDRIKIGVPFSHTPQNRKSSSKNNGPTVPEAVYTKLKQKLPFEPNDAMIKYIPTEEDNAMVIATERKVIDRHLAIYEKAGLKIKSICVWPMALANCYVKFFGRRKADLTAVVMLLDIQPGCTNVVICRHTNVLFASSIPIGAEQLEDEQVLNRLVLELTACRRQFVSIQQDARIERLIFLSGQVVNAETYKTIAKQMEIQAQMGDCLTAVEIENPYRSGVDRRNCHVNWATAFGLSLS